MTTDAQNAMEIYLTTSRWLRYRLTSGRARNLHIAAAHLNHTDLPEFAPFTTCSVHPDIRSFFAYTDYRQGDPTHPGSVNRIFLRMVLDFNSSQGETYQARHYDQGYPSSEVLQATVRDMLGVYFHVDPEEVEWMSLGKTYKSMPMTMELRFALEQDFEGLVQSLVEGFAECISAVTTGYEGKERASSGDETCVPYWIHTLYHQDVGQQGQTKVEEETETGGAVGFNEANATNPEHSGTN